MEIIPMIYIYKGKCVTFYKGDIKHATFYPQSPLSYAKLFASKGAKYLQIVDKEGEFTNFRYAAEIIEKTGLKIQIAAKTRTMELAKKIFDAGIYRIIIGVAGRGILKEAISRFGDDKVFAGVKCKRNSIITSVEIKPTDVIEYAETLPEIGVKNIIYHDVLSEGTMIHPNYDELEKIVNLTDLNVYVSGGISEIAHLKLLRETGAKGALIGKALYENKFNLEELFAFA